MLVKFEDPAERPIAFEADDVSALHPSGVEPETVTDVVLKNGKRFMVASPFADVIRRIQEAQTRK